MPDIRAVEGLEVLGTCRQGQRLSARWLVRHKKQRQQVDSNADFGEERADKKVVVRWWRSCADAALSILIEDGEMRPGPLTKVLGAPQGASHSRYYQEYGLVLLSEAEVDMAHHLTRPQPCTVELGNECGGSWVWVEVLRRTTLCAARESRSEPEASTKGSEPEASTKGRSFVGVSWARAATRIQASSSPPFEPSPKEDVPVIVKKTAAPSITCAIRTYSSPPEEKDGRSSEESPAPASNAGPTVDTHTEDTHLVDRDLIPSPLVARVESVSVIVSVNVSWGRH